MEKTRKRFWLLCVTIFSTDADPVIVTVAVAVAPAWPFSPIAVT